MHARPEHVVGEEARAARALGEEGSEGTRGRAAVEGLLVGQQLEQLRQVEQELRAGRRKGRSGEKEARERQVLCISVTWQRGL